MIRKNTSSVSDWTPGVNVHDRVEHERAYVAVTQAKIRIRTINKRIRNAPPELIDLVNLVYARYHAEAKKGGYTLYDDMPEEYVPYTIENVGNVLHSYWESDDSHPFISRLIHSFVRYGWKDKQIALAAKIVREDAEKKARWAAERAEQKANAKPAPTGKATTSGVIVKISSKEFAIGYGRASYREVMTVRTDDGFMAWGSVPTAYDANNARIYFNVGDRITFTATFEPKGDDPTFAFFKRPKIASEAVTPATPSSPTTEGTIVDPTAKEEAKKAARRARAKARREKKKGGA